MLDCRFESRLPLVEPLRIRLAAFLMSPLCWVLIRATARPNLGGCEGVLCYTVFPNMFHRVQTIKVLSWQTCEFLWGNNILPLQDCKKNKQFTVKGLNHIDHFQGAKTCWAFPLDRQKQTNRTKWPYRVTLPCLKLL